MRRAVLAAALGLALACSVMAQEPSKKSETELNRESSDPMLAWKWANFAVLALGLGYLINKHAPAFFQQRSQEIQQGILDATKAKQAAEARVAEIEKRLAGLDKEIENLRSGARADITAEGERIGQETEQRLKRIQAQSAQEIELMSRAAQDELRKYSGGLALDLAEQRIRSRMTPDLQDGLVDGFLQDLRGTDAWHRL